MAGNYCRHSSVASTSDDLRSGRYPIPSDFTGCGWPAPRQLEDLAYCWSASIKRGDCHFGAHQMCNLRVTPRTVLLPERD